MAFWGILLCEKRLVFPQNRYWPDSETMRCKLKKARPFLPSPRPGKVSDDRDGDSDEMFLGQHVDPLTTGDDIDKFRIDKGIFFIDTVFVDCHMQGFRISF